MRCARATYGVIAAGAGIWCLLIACPPVCAASGSTAMAVAGRCVMEFFRPICHQLESRSFYILGAPLAVCSRCSAIYFGFFLGTLVYPLVRNVRHPGTPGVVLVVVAVMPMVLDVALGLAGVHEPTNVTRALTGGWSGLLLPFVLIPGAIDGVHELCDRSRSRSIHKEKGLTNA